MQCDRTTVASSCSHFLSKLPWWKERKRVNHFYRLDFEPKALKDLKDRHSKLEAARQFGIAINRVWEWCNKEDELKKSVSEFGPSAKIKCLQGAGHPPFSETLQLCLVSWLEKKGTELRRVTNKMKR